MFGLGGIDLLRCWRATTSLATAQTYMTCCCEQVRHAALLLMYNNVYELPVADVKLGKEEGF